MNRKIVIDKWYCEDKNVFAKMCVYCLEALAAVPGAAA